MKQFRFTGSLCSAALVFFLTSCGGSSSEKSTSADSTATDSAKTVVVTTVITPENMLVITQKVKDYAKWKMGYDAHDSVRLAHGAHNYVIGRGLEDSNLVLVALKIDDTAKAMAFAKDPGLKTAMQKAGVIGAPTMSFLTVTWQDTVTIASRIRSRTTFMVKDWDTWFKAFDSAKQERADNGITARLISHDLYDPKKVTLVTAITDSAKAYAYYKSDMLKKRRAESGVISEPERFMFRIVQHY